MGLRQDIKISEKKRMSGLDYCARDIHYFFMSIIIILLLFIFFIIIIRLNNDFF